MKKEVIKKEIRDGQMFTYIRTSFLIYVCLRCEEQGYLHPDQIGYRCIHCNPPGLNWPNMTTNTIYRFNQVAEGDVEIVDHEMSYGRVWDEIIHGKRTDPARR